MTIYNDIKKFFIYSIVLAILIFPMVGLKSTVFDFERALVVWLAFISLLALGIVNRNFKNSKAYEALSESMAPVGNRIKKGISSVPLKIYLICVAAIILSFPLYANNYMIDVGITCMIYVVLGLGINIVVGLAGLLDLGYIAFYAVGAYTYSILNLNFGLSFWLCLPAGVVLGAIAGCIIGYPTLKMRGDYLAIVTLGFGEIIRLVLNNWDALTKGPNGLLGMAKPAIIYPSFADGAFIWGFYTLRSLHSLYYFIFIIGVLVIIGVRRLDNSRIGRAWVAVREDEMAAELSGVPTIWIKLLAYALGAAFASVVGAFFAAKLSYTNPNFFIFMESCIVLCIVVLGGAGSIPGVVIAAIVIIAVPEVFRELESYRMLAFGFLMTVMMIIKPEGIIPASRKKRELHENDAE